MLYTGGQKLSLIPSPYAWLSSFSRNRMVMLSFLNASFSKANTWAWKYKRYLMEHMPFPISAHCPRAVSLCWQKWLIPRQFSLSLHTVASQCHLVVDVCHFTGNASISCTPVQQAYSTIQNPDFKLGLSMFRLWLHSKRRNLCCLSEVISFRQSCICQRRM